MNENDLDLLVDDDNQWFYENNNEESLTSFKIPVCNFNLSSANLEDFPGLPIKISDGKIPEDQKKFAEYDCWLIGC